MQQAHLIRIILSSNCSPQIILVVSSIPNVKQKIVLIIQNIPESFKSSRKNSNNIFFNTHSVLIADLFSYLSECIKYMFKLTISWLIIVISCFNILLKHVHCYITSASALLRFSFCNILFWRHRGHRPSSNQLTFFRIENWFRVMQYRKTT